VWKPGDPERRDGLATGIVRERRRKQLDCWLAREHDRRVRAVREEHHDAHAKIIAPKAPSTDRDSGASTGK
jgi:dsDNA-binding SOS-regulon protein